VLSPTGLVYLGLANKYGVIEPHHRLPFLSWLPRSLADRYIRFVGKGSEYYEQLQTRAKLVEMCSGLTVWDYTYTVLCDPERFHALDVVPRPLRRVPRVAWRIFQPVLPTFIWIGTLGNRRPAAQPTRQPPARVR
jgi:hypothetical protein